MSRRVFWCLCIAAFVLMVPGTVWGQSYSGIPCDAADNECLLRALLFQTQDLERQRLVSQHLNEALGAKTAEAQQLQTALDKSQKDAARVVAERNMWVGVGALGGIALTTLIIITVGHATK